MVIIAFASQKGGTGKTTSAVNLSAIWAKKYKTLLVDCDPQGNAKSGVGIKDYDSFTLADVLEGKCNAAEAIANTDFNLSIIPSNVSLSELERELNTNKLRSVLRPLETEFELIVIDCPPSLGKLTASALVACTDGVLIPFKPGQYGVEGLQQLMLNIVTVRRSGANPALKLLGIFYNEINPRTNLLKVIDSQIRPAYGQYILQTVIRPAVKIAEAQVAGKPISAYNKHDSRDYIKLAKEVENKWQTINS